MSIPYVIILSDSEDEYDIAPDTIILSDSEEESYDLEDPEVESPTEEDSQEEDPEEDPEVESPMEEDFQEEDPEEEDPMEEDPEEEDPEEDDPEEEFISETPPPPSPIWNNTSDFCGAHTIRTARKSTARKNVLTQETTPLPAPSIPTIDPYYKQQTNKNWSWIADTLNTWRQEEGFPSINEVGESSIAQQTYPSTGEAPSFSIPPMIARMTAQENHISLMEDALEELPTAEVHEELQQQFTTMEQQIEEVKGVTEDLLDMGEETVNDLNIVRTQLNATQARVEDQGGRIAANTWRATDLERRINRLEVDMNQFDAMAAMLRDLEAYIHLHDITPK